jgi:hypothetical protein
MTDQRRHREQEGKLIPDAESIGQSGETSEQPLAKRNSHVSPPLDFAYIMTSWPLCSPGRTHAALFAVLEFYIAANNPWLQ